MEWYLITCIGGTVVHGVFQPVWIPLTPSSLWSCTKSDRTVWEALHRNGRPWTLKLKSDLVCDFGDSRATNSSPNWRKYWKPHHPQLQIAPPIPFVFFYHLHQTRTILNTIISPTPSWQHVRIPPGGKNGKSPSNSKPLHSLKLTARPWK